MDIRKRVYQVYISLYVHTHTPTILTDPFIFSMGSTIMAVITGMVCITMETDVLDTGTIIVEVIDTIMADDIVHITVHMDIIVAKTIINVQDPLFQEEALMSEVEPIKESVQTDMTDLGTIRIRDTEVA